MTKLPPIPENVATGSNISESQDSNGTSEEQIHRCGLDTKIVCLRLRTWCHDCKNNPEVQAAQQLTLFK